MMQVLRTMTEASPNETLQYLSECVKSSLADTRFLWDPIAESSKLIAFVELPGNVKAPLQLITLSLIYLFLEGQDIATANHQFRSLAVLHIRLTLLSDVFSATGSTQGRAAISLLQTLMNNMPTRVLTDIGTLHRAATWENIALKAGLASKGIDVQSSAISSPLEGSPNPSTLELPFVEGTNGTTGANGVQDISVTPPGANTDLRSPKRETPQDWNASSLKHITQGLPSALGTFFQGLPSD
jgi:E3 ubiquitin-protein ligase HUWE1